MITRVCLIGCGKTKLPHPAMAKDLYTGNLFRLARAWAEKHAGAYAILSAHHGVVAPHVILQPYDHTISDHTITGGLRLSPPDYRRWISASAQNWLSHFCGPNLRPEVVVLAGKEYCALLEEGHLGLVLTKPLEGMEIGQRQGWLKREAGVAA